MGLDSEFEFPMEMELYFSVLCGIWNHLIVFIAANLFASKPCLSEGLIDGIIYIFL